MAKLHIFNPEHDIALAVNLSNFTSPHAGRQLRHDLGYLPAIWAMDTDYVLVDDVEQAQTAFSRLMHRPFGHFVDKRMLQRLTIDCVEPWGWDLALRAFLLRYGVRAVPSEMEIAVVRDLSHRRHAVALLDQLRLEGTTGWAWQADSLRAVLALRCEHGSIVVKAPWSSSGRGIRFIDGEPDDYQTRWIQNVIQKQGSVVVEAYCQKVKDFGMEFESDGEGRVSYLGLSLFHTENGAYTGNVLASEKEKRTILNHYISDALLTNVQAEVCARLGVLYRGRYKGPFGIDMMVVATERADGFLLNPCVEINLRRTMGHVALALARQCPSGQVMRIDYTNNIYRLRKLVEL